MFFSNLHWWLIIVLNFVGFIIFSFGLKLNKKDLIKKPLAEIIEFFGGIIILASFALMFWLFGIISGLILIPIFWLIVTPIVGILLELGVNKANKKIELEEQANYLNKKRTEKEAINQGQLHRDFVSSVVANLNRNVKNKQEQSLKKSLEEQKENMLRQEKFKKMEEEFVRNLNEQMEKLQPKKQEQRKNKQ